MLRRANSRLAALGHLRQVEAVLASDRAAQSVSLVVRAEMRRIRALLRGPPPFAALVQALRVCFSVLRHSLAGAMRFSLRKTTLWSHRAARGALLATLPKRALAFAAARPLREDIDWEALAPPETDWLDMLFPPPSEEQVKATVYSSDWEARLQEATSLGLPDALAARIAGGLLVGEDWRAVAARLLPLVQGVESSARRIARTESLRVAQAGQMACHEQLGDLVIGYQVHATMDQHTRPWHAARSGTIYYARPRGDQKGYARMPNPPEEAQDPRERPRGAPRTAYNCRCYLTPVLRDPNDPAIADVMSEASHPDPLVYTDWWSGADEQRKRLAVGTRRYSAVALALGEHPDWEHFLAPDGRLLKTSELEGEDHVTRAARLAHVRSLLASRRREALHVSRTGWAPG